MLFRQGLHQPIQPAGEEALVPVYANDYLHALFTISVVFRNGIKYINWVLSNVQGK